MMNGSKYPMVMGHWVYVEFAQALQQGKSYTLRLRGLADNVEEKRFTYDVNRLRSETVHVNMVGFPNNGPKFAYLSQWMGDFNSSVHTQGGLNLKSHRGREFRVVNYNTGSVAYRGKIAPRLAKTVKESESADFAPRGQLLPCRCVAM